MPESRTNPKVDAFLIEADAWRAEFEELRAILLGCDLTEELKWGVPCYTYQNKNVALIHGFKDYCAILFVKGALLSDPRGLMIQQTENVQAARQIRFTGVSQIEAVKDILKAYILEAIEAEKSGRTVDFRKNDEFPVPDELREKFDEVPGLKAAFEALTPGRQRAYILHFSKPKQSRTRAAQVEKYVPQILNGKGLYD